MEAVTRVVPLLLPLFALGCSAMFDFDRFSGGGADTSPADTGVVDSSEDAPVVDAPADTADGGCSCGCASDVCGPDGECTAAARVIAIAAGTGHACALTDANAVYCWGRNDSGQVGDGSMTTRDTPVAVPLTGTAFAVGAGGGHSCAILDTGAFCWGANDRGQLGNTSADDSVTPVAVDFPRAAEPLMDRLDLGDEHSCALTRGTQNGWCWGRGNDGQLGWLTPPVSRNSPANVASGDYTSISAGFRHTCAVELSTQVFCWGTDDDEQLGNGAGTIRRGLPDQVAGAWTYSEVSAGQAHTCAISTDQELLCWGARSAGQSGRPPGSGGLSATPDPVGAGTEWVHVAAGAFHTCAIDMDRRAYCFGNNARGALGTGDTNPVDGPTPVSGPRRFERLSAGDDFTCGIDHVGRLFCWGHNLEGQLGVGDRADRTTPERVCLD